MSRQLQIGKQFVGDGSPCFITFEAGPTHNGLESALSLVKLAAEAGANAIKFQIFSADKLVEDKNQLFTYQTLIDDSTGKTKDVTEPLYNILKRRELKIDEWKEVKKTADMYNLAFFATVGFEEDIQLLLDLKVDSIKIASSDVNHYPLLRQAARSKLNVQLDTGGSEIEEIVSAVKFLEDNGCRSIIIHQCPSGYPAKIPSICLKMIPRLKKIFPNYPIAYSDHTPDADMDIAAIAFGANMVEKTITLDRTTQSVEHIFSLEPKELKQFINRLRDVETAFGSSERCIPESQKLERNKLRRGAYLKNPVKAGTKVSLDHIIFRRPCNGISADIIDTMIRKGCIYNEDYDANLCLTELHLANQ